MVQRLNLLHYLSAETYRKLCRNFGLDAQERMIGDNFVVFPGAKIHKISLYNIVYQTFGHVWFMDVGIDFPLFDCTYDLFEKKLYEEYHRLFGFDVLSDFPAYELLCCHYIEYASCIRVDNAAAFVADLAEICAPEQLDKALWNNYKKPHGTIEFCLAANGDVLETLARCHGTALKKRISDVSCHRTVGLLPSVAVNLKTEENILNRLYKKYKIPCGI